MTAEQLHTALYEKTFLPGGKCTGIGCCHSLRKPPGFFSIFFKYMAWPVLYSSVFAFRSLSSSSPLCKTADRADSCFFSHALLAMRPATTSFSSPLKQAKNSCHRPALRGGVCWMAQRYRSSSRSAR